MLSEAYLQSNKMARDLWQPGWKQVLAGRDVGAIVDWLVAFSADFLPFSTPFVQQLRGRPLAAKVMGWSVRRQVFDIWGHDGCSGKPSKADVVRLHKQLQPVCELVDLLVVVGSGYGLQDATAHIRNSEFQEQFVRVALVFGTLPVVDLLMVHDCLPVHWDTILTAVEALMNRLESNEAKAASTLLTMAGICT